MPTAGTVDAQRERLAGRLRPLYDGLRSDEFDRMVARIAEIELYDAALAAVAPGSAPSRRGRARSLPRVMAS